MKFTTVTWYSQLAAIIVGLGLFLLGIYVGTKMTPPASVAITETVEVIPSVVEETMSPIVNAELGSQQIEDETVDIPSSQVYLTATRANGDIKRIMLKEVQGSCNLLEADPIIGRDTEEFLCYYAGFGEVFRIKETVNAYAVESKEIEEASPDYNPPIQEFVTFFEVPK
ncbi:MAG: hypothetical protein KBC62_01750 [Candidatus Pacebacteria bacterium]|nr:hypothetical protein [Candidatus Paceibacterota bacterium]MBP9842705.1 hypothetical protein [Candidatus Paceibacterota bacterium]